MKKLLTLAVAALAAVLSLNAADWPQGKSPNEIGRRLCERLLARLPADWQAAKERGENDRLVHYPIVCAWDGAFWFADACGDSALAARLAELYRPLQTWKSKSVPVPDHVDYSVFGSLPMLVYAHTGDRAALNQGLAMADAQWARPKPTDRQANGMFDYEERVRLWEKGFTPQTRFWMDDMFMVTVLQLQAYKMTGERKYADRAAREMAEYLRRLQNPDGLFFHAPDAPHVWGRGNGWMAAGMAMLMKDLPPDAPCLDEIMAGYRKMMAALLTWQRADGLWGQLVNDAESWDESSGSAMFAYAFLEGAKRGWLDDAVYGAAGRKAYLALTDWIEPNGDVRGVCEGTNMNPSRDFYLGRKRLTGDWHGQAALLWCCATLAEKIAPAPDAWRVYLKPAVSFLKFLPEALRTCADDKTLSYYGTGHSGHWAVQCSLQVAAGLALLSTVPEADLKATGATMDAAEMRELALRLVRYALRTHHSGDLACVDGKHWGKHWISNLGLLRCSGGLNVLRPHMTDDDVRRLRALMEYECDFLLNDYPIRAGIWLDNMPESNIWNAGALFWAAKAFPDLPNAKGYVEKAKQMMLCGLCCPADANETWYLNKGRVWTYGPNFTENWSLDHHGYMNFGYMNECFSNLAFFYFNFLDNGWTPPPEMMSHTKDLWTVCKRMTFPDGRFARIGGDTRFRYGYCQIFAYQTWAFAAHALGDADAMRFMRGYLPKIEAEQAMNADGTVFGTRMREVRDVSWYYYCRAEADPFLTMCQALKWTRDYAFPEAAGPVAPVCETWRDTFHFAEFIRTPESFRAVCVRHNWGNDNGARKPGILVAPTGDSSLAEWQGNLVGYLGMEEETNEFTGVPPCDWEKDAVVQREYRDGNGDAFEQTCRLDVSDKYVYGEGEAQFVSGRRYLKTVAIGDGATLVVRDRVDITRDVSLQKGYRALHWLVPNDFANGFTRRFEGRAFSATLDGNAPEDALVATGERLLTVDGKMSVIAVRGADLSIRRTKERAIRFRSARGSPIHSTGMLRAEEVVMDCVNRPMLAKAGTTLFDVVYLVTVGDAAGARAMADSAKLEGNRLTFVGRDGASRTIEL